MRAAVRLSVGYDMTTLCQFDTRAAVIDLPRMLRNIYRIQSHVTELGVTLPSHEEERMIAQHRLNTLK